MATTTEAVKGGKVWESPHDTRAMIKSRNLAIAGLIFTVLTIGLSIYSVINAILTSGDYYKITTTTDTFTTPPGIWHNPMWSAIFSFIFGITAATLLWLSEDPKNPFMFKCCLFIAALISLAPFTVTAGIIAAVNQNQVSTEFAHWLKTNHSLTIPDNLPTDPLELASKPRLLKNTKGNPTLVTFKTYDNLIIFDNAIQK